jgi:hypothetical protein
MLLDELMPRFDFSEYHELKVDASAEDVWRAIHSIDFGRLPISRVLMGIRGMGLLARRRKGASDRTVMSLKSVSRYGFRRIGESDDEVVLGLIGTFWKLSGGIRDFDPKSFAVLDEPGFAKAAWNFRTVPSGTATLLSTETRVRCPDERSRASFGRYWLLIRPFSGLIRKEMLRGVKRVAEKP